MKIETEREDDRRWIAEIPDIPGVLAYGKTKSAACAKAHALALRVVADRLDAGEAVPPIWRLWAEIKELLARYEQAQKSKRKLAALAAALGITDTANDTHR